MYGTHFGGRIPIEQAARIIRGLANTDPEYLETIYRKHQERLDKLDEIHQANFKKCCERCPLLRDFDGLEFFDSHEQRLEYRALADEAHYMEQALRGDAHTRILIRRKLRKLGVRDILPDLPFHRLKALEAGQ